MKVEIERSVSLIECLGNLMAGKTAAVHLYVPLKYTKGDGNFQENPEIFDQNYPPQLQNYSILIVSF